MNEFEWKLNNKHCPLFENGDCKGQVIGIFGPDDLIYEVCEFQLCPHIFWLTLQP